MDPSGDGVDRASRAGSPQLNNPSSSSIPSGSQWEAAPDLQRQSSSAGRGSGLRSHNGDVALTPSDKLLPQPCAGEGLRLEKDTWIRVGMWECSSPSTNPAEGRDPAGEGHPLLPPPKTDAEEPTRVEFV